MLNLVGEKYGRLLVIKEVDRIKGKRAFLCKCECGTQKIIRMSDLRSGKVISCGCARNEKIAALGKTKKDQVNVNNGIDLTGQKFGRLTVLELDKEETLKHRKIGNKCLHWKCQCDCGNITSVRSTSLRNGMTQSCGCLQKERCAENMKIKIQPKGALSRRKDLTNQKFGLLTAISINEEITKEKGRVHWNCNCLCGNTKIVAADSLVSGATQSCGCLKNSKGEYYIEQLLKENNISFLKEVTFNNLKDKQALRFDFALLNKENQIIELIEYDGIQHFEPIQFGGISETKAIEVYNQQIIHDKMKNNWCKDNNIPLIRIPYTHLKDLCLEDLLLETSLFLF